MLKIRGTEKETKEGYLSRALRDRRIVLRHYHRCLIIAANKCLKKDTYN